MVMKVQTSQLEALCDQVKLMTEQRDVLCSHTGHLGDMNQNLITIANGVKGVENKTGVVSSFVSSTNEQVHRIGVIICHKAKMNLKAEEERRFAEQRKAEGKGEAEVA